MAKILLFISAVLLTLPAFAQSEPDCQSLPKTLGHWQTTHADDYLLCQIKNDKGDVVLNAFFSTHPGTPTYGLNFYRMTQGNETAYVWFSDRGADGLNKNIARTFMRSGNGKFPVLMIFFTFENSTDFVRKAELVTQFRIEP